MGLNDNVQICVRNPMCTWFAEVTESCRLLFWIRTNNGMARPVWNHRWLGAYFKMFQLSNPVHCPIIPIHVLPKLSYKEATLSPFLDWKIRIVMKFCHRFVSIYSVSFWHETHYLRYKYVPESPQFYLMILKIKASCALLVMHTSLAVKLDFEIKFDD